MGAYDIVVIAEALVPQPPAAGAALTAPPPDAALPPPRRLSWAALLRHVFALDALTWPHCGGRRSVVCVVTERHPLRRLRGTKAVRRVGARGARRG